MLISRYGLPRVKSRYQGEPQFRADFSNWNLSAKGVKGPFTFTPPKNAEQIQFIVRNRAEAGIPAQEGDAK
jgi:hypothetical protein